jgi:primosomal protein N' (replication factor Y) (superfamily II helicase)
MSQAFSNVALPLPLRTLFTYALPDKLRGAVLPGCRVLVPFRNKSLVGVVVELLDTPPREGKIREIIKPLDLVPALPPGILDLGKWIANYYVAPIGEVFRAMLPPVVEVRRERLVALTTKGRELAERLAAVPLNLGSLLERFGDRGALGDRGAEELSPEERRVLSALYLNKRPKGSEAPASPSVLSTLSRQGLVEITDHIRERARRMQKILAWRSEAPRAPRSGLRRHEEKIERVRRLLETERGPLPLVQLLKLAQVTRAFVARMLREGFLESWEEVIDPAEDPFDTEYRPPAHELNAQQDSAMKAIRGRFELGEFAVQLLHGVTGSGKTEVYLRAVQETLARGKTAIILVPEIALTLWIGRQCRAWFGARFEGVAVLHSALTDVERAREWWRVRNGHARVVVGTRSAVFAPVENLGLIIVDEEQEGSYKQEETPKYHGRDVAIVRAKLENALALLGSATPSLESYHHAREGKYELITMSSRVAQRPMASVQVVDLREDFQQTHKRSPISAVLHTALEQCLASKTQALILVNRRGYSWSVLCRSCGASVECVNCSISMTHHKSRNRLECHYCGSIQAIPKECPKCQSQYVYFFGEGSEQLEEQLRKQFAGARIARLDRDTARTKRQYQETLGAFAEGALDFLVGTQMLAKGHDFHRVTVVGVVSADASLTLPDFRAAERTFQLLTQVAGRAGRGELTGRVLIQTYYPEHYAVEQAVRQDYLAFFERELHFRRMLAYPPFTALANIIVRHTELETAIRWTRLLSGYFSPFDGNIRVLGPAAAPLSRLKREHRFQFLLKSPKRSLLTKVLSGAVDFCDKHEIPQTAAVIDVDPLSLL